MRKDKKSLAETHPEVAKQWHPTKNGDLIPNNVTPGSNKKVWWKCDKGEDHEWLTSINKRSAGSGCTICSGNKVVKSNCLATFNPKLAKQWHPTKNGDLTPYNILPKVNYKVWWKCDNGNDHEWQQSPNVRLRRKEINECPICLGRILVKSNSIANLRPDLAKQWHHRKNGDLTPYEFTLKSKQKIWWKCDKGDDHEWLTSIYNRSRGSGCLICSGHKTAPSTSIGSLFPELAKQWHPTKNGKLTPFEISKGSEKKVWWKCDKGDYHEWMTSTNSRVSNNLGCPVCSNQKIIKSNSLATTNPELAKQWHPTKNGKLTPLDLGEGSSKKVWWKCDKGDDHIWKVSVNNRNQGKNCPVCENLKVVKSNCLATTNPELAKQWHPTKNGNLTPHNVVEGARKQFWWKCNKGDDHEWKAAGYSRSKGIGCPFCDLTPQSKQELTITFELIKLFKNIDPKGLKTKLEGRLRAIDIYIPKLNLCIEFDGSYWHKDKRDIDKIKSEMLFEEGFKLIRVREEPLKKIYDTDVISKQPYDGKQVTNDILSMILSIFELDAKLVSKIKTYQSKDGLQNEKGLEIYIDKILTEKAEKNGSI
jgi:hypothetical protein